MIRLFVLMSLAACATPGTPSADSARNADAAPAPRSQAAQVLMPNSPLLDDAIAAAPEETHVHEADVDPVCGMKVNPETARGGSITRDGHTYFFCSSTCRNTFLSRDGGAP
jgi:YHS domain-containing protein